MELLLIIAITAYVFYEIGKQQAYKNCKRELERNIDILKNQRTKQ